MKKILAVSLVLIACTDQNAKQSASQPCAGLNMIGSWAANSYPETTRLTVQEDCRAAFGPCGTKFSFSPPEIAADGSEYIGVEVTEGDAKTVWLSTVASFDCKAPGKYNCRIDSKKFHLFIDGCGVVPPFDFSPID